jgi:hypothetical protein
VTKTNTLIQGATLDELSQLLAQFRELLPSANLNEKTSKVINADLQIIEAETKDTQPSLPIIESKLKSIASIVKSMVEVGTATTTLLPLLQKAADLAQVLFK